VKGPDPTRILIVDDHKMVRNGLRTFISVNEDLTCVGEARNGEEAIEQCAALQPDVVLMDLKMPVMDGPTAIEHIRNRFPDVNIIALTTFDDPALARRSLEAGAVGYLLKDVEQEELVSAIRLAREGRGVVAANAMQALVARSAADDATPYSVALTQREGDILRLVASGLTNPQIGERLLISTSTVNFHVHNVLGKLGAKTRTEAVSIASREGLLEA
jgi:NarL family two-component system response regulator LiaR